VALLRKMTCNLRHPTGLRHSVLGAGVGCSVWGARIGYSRIVWGVQIGHSHSLTEIRAWECVCYSATLACTVILSSHALRLRSANWSQSFAHPSVTVMRSHQCHSHSLTTVSQSSAHLSVTVIRHTGVTVKCSPQCHSHAPTPVSQ